MNSPQYAFLRQLLISLASLTWFAVSFTFSFTNRELQTQPLTTLREQFEQLDIKLMTDYNNLWTTHVVSKKRNTAKGLQALINGKLIVTESFLEAVIQAAAPPQDGAASEPSALETDFSRHWPDAMKHLPPPGGEPVQHPDSIYAPDVGREDIFDGYTFIFYDAAQYNNLLAPITNGSGKALLETVESNKTQVDDFVRYVKSVAGEKGLGSFDDGSEGKGVVLVRYVPAKGAEVSWYTDFFTAVSLRLDHRPIEQSEFLEAILIKDASILRRPLEVESLASQDARLSRQGQVDVQSQPSSNADQVPPAEPAEESQPPPRRGRARQPVKRRFAGFDGDSDMDMDDPPAPVAERSQAADEEGGLFVSQEPDQPEDGDSSRNNRTSQRKRHASPLPEDDLMDGMAPTAARFKRQRQERGEDVASVPPEPVTDTAQKPPKKKVKKELDVLAMVKQHREEEEARARAEREDLANLPDDVDLSEIRRLNIVEEMEVRQPAEHARTRDQDVADGRWDPKWNGMKNFKKFRRRGEATGRQPARVIVPLTQVKSKEFGVGDDYWLEDEETSQRKRKSQPSLQETPKSPPRAAAPARRAIGVVISDESEEDDEDSAMVDTPVASSTRSTRKPVTQSQSNAKSQASGRTTQSQGKRPAPEPAKEQPAKRQRPARKAMEIADSDDSDDDLKFRFGKRR